MKDLVSFIVKEITGSQDFEISEEETNGVTSVVIKTPPEVTGMVIGKQGKTIRAIRTLVRVKAILDKKLVNVSVEPRI